MTHAEIIKTVKDFYADVEQIRVLLGDAKSTGKQLDKLGRRMRRLVWTLEQQEKSGVA